MGAAMSGQGAVPLTNAQASGDAGVAMLAGGAGDAPLCDAARAIIGSRRSLSSHLEAALFANPGLDIMLFLFAEGVNGATVTTNACCAAAGVPRTTALRWVKLLQDRGLIVGSDDISDRRVTMLALTERARDIIRQWLAEVIAMPAMNRSLAGR